jgi:hypothetical protein
MTSWSPFDQRCALVVHPVPLADTDGRRATVALMAARGGWEGALLAWTVDRRADAVRKRCCVCARQQDIPQTLLSFETSPAGVAKTKSLNAVVLVHPSGHEITLCDAPGYGDSKSPEVDIVNCYSIVKALQQAKTVTPVFISTIRMYGERASDSIKQLADTLSKFMDIEAAIGSFVYIFTKDWKDTPGDERRYFRQFFTTQEDDMARDGQIDANTDSFLKDIISKIAQHPYDHVNRLRPSASRQQRKDVLQYICTGVPAIQAPAEVFSPFVTPSARQALTEAMPIFLRTVQLCLLDKKQKADWVNNWPASRAVELICAVRASPSHSLSPPSHRATHSLTRVRKRTCTLARSSLIVVFAGIPWSCC